MVPNDTITFTLEGERMGLPLPGETPEQAAQAPRFGAEFGGTFTFRPPTIGEDMRIAAAVTSFFEQHGVADQRNVPWLTHGMAWAVAFFGVVGTAKPAWFDEQSRATSETRLAFAAAYRMACERMEAAKKNGGGSGGS